MHTKRLLATHYIVICSCYFLPLYCYFYSILHCAIIVVWWPYLPYLTSGVDLLLHLPSAEAI